MRRLPKPRTRHRVIDDDMLDDIVSRNTSAMTRRYQRVCETRLRAAVATMSLEPALLNRYIEQSFFATIAPVSFEVAMTKVGLVAPTHDLGHATRIYERVRDRRYELTANNAWVVVSQPIFNNAKHRLHVHAQAISKTTGALLVTCTESVDINYTPFSMMIQCACCGSYVRETYVACGCAAVRACSNECLKTAARELKHDCFAEDSRLRNVCARMIISQPTFPFVNVVEGTTGRFGIPVHTTAAINLLHHCPADLGVSERDVVDALVYECSKVQQLLTGAARRLSAYTGTEHRAPPHAIRLVQESLPSTVDASKVVVL